jgi:Tol biopolymer transport system component
MLSGSTRWVSTNAAVLLGDTSYRCFEAAASADGATVIFYAATNGGSVHLLHHSITNGITEVVSTNARAAEWPQISPTGELVAYASGTNVYVWNAQTRSNVLVNADSNGLAAVGVSHSPVLSPNAQRVAFLSSATNLTANGFNQRFQVYARDLLTGETWLVSRNTNGVASNRDIDATLQAFSPDGQYLAFETQGTDLVANDLNDDNDIFLHGLASGETKLVSTANAAAGPTTALKSSRVWPGSLSTNGDVMAFTSADNYLSSTDTNQLIDIFIPRLGAATMLIRPPISAPPFEGWRGSNPILSSDGRILLYEAVRQADAGMRPTNNYWADLATGTNRSIFETRVGSPTISGDGRWIAFHSSSTPSGILSLTLIDQDSDVFLYDTVSNRYDLVSRRYGFIQSTTGDAINGRISPDGRWVLYQTFASDAIQTNFTSSRWRVYARDMGAPALSNRTELISTGPLASPGSPVPYESDYSPDSRFAVITWRFGEAMLYDFQSGRLVQVGSGWSKPAISDDGKFVAHETVPTNREPTQVFVRNVESGFETLLSGASGAPGNGDSSMPQIAPDGRFIFFESKASNLVENDTNGASDIFLADRVLGRRMLISLNRHGSAAGNGASSMPVLSGDGRVLVFNSFASDLVAGDFNNTREVFMLRLGRPDSDGDGMDDDWEVAFFGDLSRTGGGDFDQDGYTDAEEFRAGTSPGDSTSVLRVLTLTRATGGPTTILWASAPGRTYRVDYKDDLTAPWLELGTASGFGSTGSIADGSPTSMRFYRVVLIE